jgi:succinate dehydrogenase/fumarate reductase cytochrome b subunit
MLSTFTLAALVYVGLFIAAMAIRPEWFDESPSKNSRHVQDKCFMSFFAAGAGAVIVYHAVATFRQ